MSYARVLVATDLSAAAQIAGRVAARWGNERTRYRVVHVLPSLPAYQDLPDEPEETATRARREAAMPAVAAWAEDTGLVRAEAEVLAGSAAREIAKAASAFLADLVIVGNRGRTDASGKLLGRTARAILRTSPCDVLLVREDVPGDARPHLRRILVATDLRSPSQRAAERAARLAKEHNASVELVHVVDADDAPLKGALRERSAVALARFARDGFPVGAPGTVLLGRPEIAIADRAKETGADLVVVGAHGEDDEGMLGSNAEAIAELSPANVLIVRR